MANPSPAWVLFRSNLLEFLIKLRSPPHTTPFEEQKRVKVEVVGAECNMIVEKVYAFVMANFADRWDDLDGVDVDEEVLLQVAWSWLVARPLLEDTAPKEPHWASKAEAAMEATGCRWRGPNAWGGRKTLRALSQTCGVHSPDVVGGTAARPAAPRS